jgi:hypothetical protein
MQRDGEFNSRLLAWVDATEGTVLQYRARGLSNVQPRWKSGSPGLDGYGGFAGGQFAKHGSGKDDSLK